MGGVTLLKTGKSKIPLIIAISVIAVAAIAAALVVIPGINRSNQYKQGVTYAEHGLYDEAVTCFSALGGYQDSDSWLDYCLLKKAAGQADWKAVGQYAAKIPGFKDADGYAGLSSACRLHDSGDAEAALDALKGLDALPETADLRQGWQDAYVQDAVNRVSGMMARSRWDDALAEIDRALAYCGDSRLTEARTECVGQIRRRDYQQALELIRQARYSDALALLKPMADYEDSQTYIRHLEAGEPGELYLQARMTAETDPHILADMYAAAGDYADAAEQAAAYREAARSEDYSRALALMEQREWQPAREILAGLEGYRDSLVQMAACDIGLKQERYDQAKGWMERGQDERAAAVFLELGDFADSRMQYQACQDRLREMRYQWAAEQYRAGDAESAYPVFKELEDYKDSRIYCAWIENEGGYQK